MNDFDKWNELKKEINKKEVVLTFREREIFFVYLGKNIGFEQDGRGEEFLRPVLILKKFNERFFLGVILTKQCKDNIFYYKLEENSCVVLSQIRIFDAKRLKYFYKRISENKFNKVVNLIEDLILPKRESGLTSSFTGDIIPKKNEIKKYYSQIRDIKVGKNVVFVEPINLYECELRDNVFVGPFVEIQKGVIIGENTRIQSHSFICELVTIGKDCFIGHGVMFINDLFKDGKPSGDSDKWRKTGIEDNVSIGSNATILPVKICSNVVIGAGSVVTKDITKSGIYVGNPAKLIRKL